MYRFNANTVRLQQLTNNQTEVHRRMMEAKRTTSAASVPNGQQKQPL